MSGKSACIRSRYWLRTSSVRPSRITRLVMSPPGCGCLISSCAKRRQVADYFASAVVTGLATSGDGALFVSPAMAASAKLPSLSYREDGMPSDLSDMSWLSAVNWLYVAIMALFAFVAALLGGLISFRNRIGGALIAA